MSKLMPLELLSSIRGARPSKEVNKLFMIIREAQFSPGIADEQGGSKDDAPLTTEDLRDDVIIESSPKEREIIKTNFPERKGDYLVVSKVIEEF